MKKLITKSETATRKLGAQLAKKMAGGEIIGLVGDLGAGKTILVQGLAQGLGLKKIVNSPTFVLMKNYRLRGKIIKQLCHVDCYRLDDPQALLDIGINDYLGRPDTVCVIEWADKIKKILPKKQVKWIKLEHGRLANQRIVNIF
ncbi:MAG: tRNA (adenosine(37)-N6)-threonylcarbamoyltransferase complex ATPase subunit type 1 TsaE [bacterium]